MTIFTSKFTEKKNDANSPSPEVVSEYKLLVGDEKLKSSAVIENGSLGGATVAMAIVPRHRQSLFRLYALLLSLIILMMMIVLGGIMIYRNFLQTKMVYHGFCGVRYRESSHLVDTGDDDDYNLSEMDSGEFEQEISIDDMQHERLEVPSIGDTRRATVLHDFNKNVSAIIDREQSYCFIMPLNRSLVMPPRDLVDLLVKLKTGYYIPDVEVVRENYRAVTPPLQDLTLFGFSIWNECHTFNSYKLVRDDEPIAISKRSAEWCEFEGEKWCLGDSGASKMLCIDIKGCM